jgi:hypothetical protein|tara:strand:+ start:6592 stop:7296 length:705 start_codon:yes stop_codon:yes gene_type:complete
MAGIKRIGVDLPDRKTTVDSWFTAELEEACSSWGFSGTEDHFNASGFGNPCDRYHWYAFRGRIPKKPLTGKFARLLQHGNTFEDRMEKYLLAMGGGTILAREFPVAFEEGAFRITGRIDFIIRHLNLGKVVLELKTINDKGYKALGGKPKDEHMLQVQMYLECLNLDWGLVAYENKNDQDVKTFRVARDKEYWAKQVKRGQTIISDRFPPFECSSKYPRWCDCLRATGVSDNES